MPDKIAGWGQEIPVQAGGTQVGVVPIKDKARNTDSSSNI